MNWLEWDGTREENRMKAMIQALRVASNWIVNGEPCEEMVSELFKEIFKIHNSTSSGMIHPLAETDALHSAFIQPPK
ncbi:MAG: hypothetical protein AB1485_09690, partial [Candidatus Thermoplasmatota archaeon]